MLALRVAWRSLWRNSRRTAVSIAALVTSTSVLIVIYSLILGLVDQIVFSVTDLGIGEAQVHGKSYLLKRSLHETIDQPERILAAANEAKISAAPRGLGVGLLACGNKSAGAQLYGVDPTAEQKIGAIPTRIQTGDFLAPSSDPKIPVVLGARLALWLDAKVGSEVVLVVQAADGSTDSELLRVVGVLQPIGEAIDRGGAFIPAQQFGAIFGLEGRVHEIALSSHARITSDAVVAAVASSAGSNDVRTWRRLLPNVEAVVKTWNAMSAVITAIFFVAAGLGVLNTMLMASYERIPEFGLIKALGATPWRILRDISLESLMLGLIGTGIGALLGALGAYYASTSGIDVGRFTGSVSFSGVSMSTIWHAKLVPVAILEPAAAMLAVSLLAALYPAFKAARLDPIAALTHV